MPASVQVSKYSGASNTFVFVDENEAAKISDRKKFVVQICDPVLGVSADGCVFLKDGGKNIEWDFYNNDGSSAEMCGNAARCVGRYLSEKSKTPSPWSLKTLSGNVELQLNGNLVSVQMKHPEVIFKNEEAMIVDTGVPHAVLPVPSLDFSDLKKQQADLNASIMKWRFPVQAKAAGCNVTFACEISPNQVKSVSFERGVEGFTLACGTGAVAAAYWLGQKNSQQNVSVQVPGGNLQVEMKNNSRPVLTGEAKKLSDITYYL